MRVKKGDVLADGPCTELGELALGRNVLVAFMPWRGYNFEDAILISEKLVREDYYTSIHIEEFEIEARDTKLGPEEITRDIPNVSESALKDLDESGIVRIGATVKAGDILVGKVTPKGETQLTPEEKLLRAIFGEKAGDVRDASLKVPPGIEGTIVDVKIFSRKGVEKDVRAKEIEQSEIARLEKNIKDEVRILTEERNKKVSDLLVGKPVTAPVRSRTGQELLKTGEHDHRGGARAAHPAGDPAPDRRRAAAHRRGRDHLQEDGLAHRGPAPGQRRAHRSPPEGRRAAARRHQAGQGLRRHEAEAPGRRQDGRPARQQGRHLPHPAGGGHALHAGRHAGRDRAQPAGRAQPYERRPDPGDPPRVGRQGARLQFATPVFDGARESDIKDLLKEANLPSSGKTPLYDGMTGEAFEQKVTVGYIYMLKLSHLVDDKIHARSIGPYSLITQQPLGGKAQFGGQRFGEMEVWALEAYGAAYTLQELLTVKSDDVEGRSKVYEAIVKGDVPEPPGLPESFNVLVRELQSLCLDVELLKV